MTKQQRSKSELLSENELVREVKRIFPRLALKASYLSALNNEHDNKAMWGIFIAKNNFNKPVAKIEARIVSALQARDFIEQKNTGMLVLSDTGRAWYRRITASVDPYRTQHHLLAEASVTMPQGIKQRVKINEGESPLGWLRRRKSANGQPFLSLPQYDAGERLRRDFMLAHLMPSTTSNWASPMSGKKQRRLGGAGGMAELRDNVIAAKSRFFKALDTVGPELSGVLMHVCCHLNGLEDAEKSLGWPQRSGKVVLQIALEVLARHYGLIRSERARPKGPDDIYHWGAEGYRPNIDGA